jgi:hypothetical protein
MQTRPSLRIIITQAKLRELGRERAVTFWTGSHRVELVLSDDVGPPDPPQAREFLPLKRRNNRK